VKNRFTEPPSVAVTEMRKTSSISRSASPRTTTFQSSVTERPTVAVPAWQFSPCGRPKPVA